MKDLFSYAIIFLLGSFITYLLYDKINKKVDKNNIVIVDTGLKKIDSINYEHNVKEEKLKKDSLTLSQQKDSINNKYQQAKYDLSEQVKENVRLSYAVKLYESIKDTSSFYLSCDSLAGRVIILDSSIVFFQAKADSLNSINDNINKVSGMRLSEWKKTSEQLTNESKRQAKIIDSLTGRVESLKGKKYTISIGPFGGLTPFGFTGGVGIVVGRKIAVF